ncbi:MAG: glycosyltransferase family 2 protein [Deltaproteobacteria bacterium]|nr:glycosyltransferase family 2 protein [Deltaproteobacteria bacterium]
MSSFDITVIVTAHDETVVSGPTMRSAESAIIAAEARGFGVERLIAMDGPTAECRDYFSQTKFYKWKMIEYDFCDPYRTRNASVEAARGRWIAFLDADDLFSENWLMLGGERMAQAEKDGEKAIVHPEINWIFDGAHSVSVKPEQEEEYFTPYYFYFANYYAMLCMAPRRAVLEIPYGFRDLESGFGYQDWQWNIETMAAGWRHVVARDTIIFVRRRDMSISVENRQRKTVIRSLEPMAIDRVGKLAH